MIFVFECHQEVFHGLTPFKVCLYTMFLAHIPKTFTQDFCIWYHYIVSFVVGVGSGTATYWFVIVVVFFWMVGNTDLVLYPV